MLEKIGLPPKPSARGRTWVIDASHCQQCASPFSIFNRKHHCRRCGGLFCGSCVQSRMYLRGQGDSPVRICEPCKKLEEAARFEARHGRKKKDESNPAEELLLKSLLNVDDQTTSSSSSVAVEPVTPESLRRKAQEEKVKYVNLKKEGRCDDATKAFKRSKELERQADALALALRKNSRIKASSNASTTSIVEEQTSQGERKTVLVASKTKITGEDDLLKELKELGWSEADLSTKQVSDADILREGGGGQKTSKTAGSLQMEILGHKRRALTLKREGKLAEAKEELKKAKNLERRLEEIETLGEDEEDEEEDGDELSAVLRALEKEISSQSVKPVPLDGSVNLPSLSLREDDDAHVDVTDTDMSDPDMIAALKVMGWAEEAGVLESFNTPFDLPVSNTEGLQGKILAHKRKALALKRSGNLAEARKELSQAKSLEQTMDAPRRSEETIVENTEHVEVTDHDLRDPEMLAALQALGFGGDELELLKPVEKSSLQHEVLAVKRSEAAVRRQSIERQEIQQNKMKDQKLQSSKTRANYSTLSDDDDDDEDVMKHIKDITADSDVAAMLKGLSLDEISTDDQVSSHSKSANAPRIRRRQPVFDMPTKSKRELQQELLGRKRKALSLRREGKDEEADKELKEASVLDMQLKALEEAEKTPQAFHVEDEGQDDDDDGGNEEVTVEDMIDPALLAALSAMGLKEEAAAPQSAKDSRPGEAKAGLGQEEDDAGFEGEYGEIGQVVDIIPPFFSKVPRATSSSKQQYPAPPYTDKKLLQVLDQTSTERKQKGDTKPSASSIQQASADSSSSSIASSSGLQQEILERKRKALNLKRCGDLAGAREELRQAKLLEKQRVKTSGSSQQKSEVMLEVAEQQQVAEEMKLVDSTRRRSSGGQAQTSASRSSKDRMKLQQESLAHKRRALTLRREGKVDEAEAEFELAKSLEKQMEEMEGVQVSAAVEADGMMEEFMDPQLAAALAGLGFKNTEMFSSGAQNKMSVERPQVIRKTEDSLQERIKGLKLRAVELKRAGKPQEALEALRDAKRLEKIPVVS